MTRWTELTGKVSREDYAARFATLARSGKEVHGEARFCAALVPAGARVLDAGCGTGRVMIRLAELGYDCVGVDLDASMLAVARKQAPGLPWFQADLAEFEPALSASKRASILWSLRAIFFRCSPPAPRRLWSSACPRLCARAA